MKTSEGIMEDPLEDAMDTLKALAVPVVILVGILVYMHVFVFICEAIQSNPALLFVLVAGAVTIFLAKHYHLVKMIRHA